jgi:hypothetical protein
VLKIQGRHTEVIKSRDELRLIPGKLVRDRVCHPIVPRFCCWWVAAAGLFIERSKFGRVTITPPFSENG